MNAPGWWGLITGALILTLLTVDFGLHRGDRQIALRKALIASGAWVGVSVVTGLMLGAVRDWSSAEASFAAV